MEEYRTMPPDQQETNALHLISDILDRMIESQNENAKANTSLKGAVDEMHDTLKEMNTHFTNGFRAEIKSHMTSELEKYSEEQEEMKKDIETTNEKLDELSKMLLKPSFWVKLIATIIASLAIIIIAGAKLLEYLGGL